MIFKWFVPKIRDFVKSGVVVKVFTNANTSTVYWQITMFSSKYNKFAGFRKHIQLEHHFSNNVQVFSTLMLDFIRICSQNRICGLVTIQFSRDFVKSGVIYKLYINAYASTVYWQKSKFSSKHHKFSEFREYIQLEHHFSHNVQVL